MDRLYSLADIARELGLPHSTVRYYRDRFADYFPTVGEGRNRRYRPEAIAVVRTIAAAMSQGMTVEQVEELLAQNFPCNVSPSQQQPVATQQPLPYTPQQIAAMINAMATAIQALNQSVQQIAAAVERIEERLERVEGVREELSEFREQMRQFQETAATLGAEQSKQLAELAEKVKQVEEKQWSTLTLDDVRKAIAEAQQSSRQPWWRRLFRSNSE